MRAVSPIRPCRVGVLAAACLLLALGRAQDAKPDIDQEMKTSLRSAYAYRPATEARPAPVKLEADLILLPRIVVLTRSEAQGLDEAIAHQDAVDDRFTLYKGGSAYSRTDGRVRADLVAWYNDDQSDRSLPGGSVAGLNVLKLSW